MATELQHVAVYILQENVKYGRAQRLARLFTDAMFIVHLMKMNADNEVTKVKWILTNAKRRFANMPVLIIKDSSITNCDANSVAQIVSAAIQYDHQWHLLYLCRWWDDCNAYRDPVLLAGRSYVVRTQAPRGFQAIVFSRQGRDKLLDALTVEPIDQLEPYLYQRIQNGKLDAICTTPNLFHVDVHLTKLYEQAAECRFGRASTRAPNLWPFAIILIALLFIVMLRRWIRVA